jgi:hypothetical protein
MALFPTRYSLFALLLLLAACSRQPSITGEWALTEVRLLDQMSRSTVNINVSNPDATKQQFRALYGEKFLAEEAGDGEWESEIDTILAYAQKAGLRLSSNREFGMDSYGLIVPKAVPGWNFGDRLLGEWNLKKDTLALTIGDGEIGYTFRFIVLEKSSKMLKLRELQDVGSGSVILGNETTYSRK